MCVFYHTHRKTIQTRPAVGVRDSHQKLFQVYVPNLLMGRSTCEDFQSAKIHLHEMKLTCREAELSSVFLFLLPKQHCVNIAFKSVSNFCQPHGDFLLPSSVFSLYSEPCCPMLNTDAWKTHRALESISQWVTYVFGSNLKTATFSVCPPSPPHPVVKGMEVWDQGTIRVVRSLSRSVTFPWRPKRWG